MPAIFRDKDFLSGCLFFAIGAFFAVDAPSYGLGTARRMGPGYFPLILGIVLALIGLTLAIRAFIHNRPDTIPRLYVRPVVAVTVAIVAFGFVLDRAGLVIATIVAVFLSGLGSAETRLWELALVAVGIAALASLLFVQFLGLPIPLWWR